jgi:hypothetical protein
MARVQLFLSTASAEFLSYRERLRHLLTRPDVEVKVQEDFIVTGNETLEMLDAYIQGCDGVIHLVGDMTGAMAMAPFCGCDRTEVSRVGQPVSAGGVSPA